MEKKSIGVLILLGLMYGLFSCGGSSTASSPKQQGVTGAGDAAASQAESAPEPVSVGAVQILVTFMTGRVVAIADGVERELDIGEEVAVQERVRAEADGVCDLQFGSMATVRIRSGATVSIRDYIGGDAGKIDIGLEKGAILCKVQKLSGNERFEIRTSTTVCGVRGTEFIVNASDPGKTKISVKKGKVAVIPASLDPQLAQAKAEGGPAASQKSGETTQVNEVAATDQMVAFEVAAVLDSYFMDQAQVVEADREMTVTKADSDKAAPIVTALTTEVKTVMAELPAPAAPAADAPAAGAPSAGSSAASSGAAPAAAEKDAAAGSASAAAASGSASAPTPANALEPMARRSFSEALLASAPEMTEKLRANLQTKVTQVAPKTAAVSAAVKEEFVELAAVRLMTVAPAAVEPSPAKSTSPASPGAAASTPAAVPEEIKTARVVISTNPGEAEIFIDSIPAGRGKAGGLYQVGSKLKVEVRAVGYVPATLDVDIADQKAQTIPVTLEREKRSYQFKVVPENGEILVDGSVIGTGSGEVTLDLGSTHEVLFRAAAHDEQRTSFTVQSSGSSLISQTLERTQVNTLIRANPQDASITIGGRRVGTGTYTLRAPVGDTVSITAQAPGWEPKTQSLVIEQYGSREIQISLERQKRIYEFQAAPPTAEIILDGNRVGVEKAQAELEVGSSHEVLFRASGYEDKRTSFTIQPSGSSLISQTLERTQVNTLIRANPQDASITIDGRRVGTGSYTLRAPLGETVSITAQAPGWEPKTQSLVIEQYGSREIQISLERQKRIYEFQAAPPTAEIVLDGNRVGVEKAQAELEVGSSHEVLFRASGYEDKRSSFVVPITGTTKIEATLARGSRTVSLNVQPSDAQVLLGGKPLAAGTRSVSAVIGESLAFAASKKGYLPQEQKITVSETGSLSVEFALAESEVFDRLKVGAAPIAGVSSDSQGRVFVSDSAGTLTAFDSSGKRLWQQTTLNKPNELSYPVLIGDGVCFSGSKELLILGAADGAVRTRAELDKDGSHMFGNRAIPMGDLVVVPTNVSLQVNDRSGMLLRTLPVADGSLATPSVWKDALIVLTQKGTVAIIDPATGALRKSIVTKAVQPVGAAPVVAGDRIYFSDRKGSVFAVDLSGTVLWSKPATAEGIGAFVDLVVDRSGVYGLFKQTVVGLSLGDGSPLFNPLPGAATSPILTESGLGFGTIAGNFEFRDPKTGALTKSIPLGAKAAGKPVQVGAYIAVGTASGEVVLVNPRGK